MKLLTVIRDALRRCANSLDRVTAEPVEREQLMSLEELRERARKDHMRARRAGRRPWYHSRPGEVKIPDSLRYYEDIHGTRATVEMLKRVGRKLDDG